MNFRIVLFAITFIFGIVFSLPSLTNMEGKKINLGLDLQGGINMLLGIKDEEAIKSKLKSVATGIKYSCQDEEIYIDDLRVNDSIISFELLDNDEKANLDKLLGEYKGVLISQDNNIYKIKFTEQEKLDIKEFALNQAIDTIRNRLNQFGLSEPVVARQGKDKILVEIAGVKTPAEEKRIRELIAAPSHLQLMAVDEPRADQVYDISEKKLSEFNNIILPDISDENLKYLVKELPIVEGDMLTDARVEFDQQNRPMIGFSLNSIGAKIFANFTENNIGNRLAVVLDNKVYSAPTVQARIAGSGQITGQFSLEEARDVAVALRSGALLAPIVLLEKRSVGPSLGSDSINAGMISLLIGFLMVIIFMLVYYKTSGLISNLALISNLFIILAVMAFFGATLTLPGMAGIVLTVGMAVDANVIINERIREFLREGKSIKQSIKEGYENAFSAIFDANITTLLVAIILYGYGTGPIKGFAITISIGILASMLTAIVGTRGIYQLFEKRIKNSNLWFGIKVVK
ncbi:MAG: Protein-export membrane protein SecD (TC 3.A.5.1.1) [uncultured Campylobacterales bacterium]|uniref:Protein translocase subunit SecD n=1 Tax=uncultured Campylobacterales bacterium TaxID=352960 RepID=A0A6S6TDY1_9BACT|nr:MAG: Protein-export membrane protein SecD (TC 3.A.5.1.1) [uncultured Campylobacterales bacterium]